MRPVSPNVVGIASPTGSSCCTPGKPDESEFIVNRVTTRLKIYVAIKEDLLIGIYNNLRATATDESIDRVIRHNHAGAVLV